MSGSHPSSEPLLTVVPDSRALLVESTLRSVPSVLVVGTFFGGVAGALTASVPRGLVAGGIVAIVLSGAGMLKAKMELENREYRIYDDRIEQEKGVLSTTLRNVRYEEATDIKRRQSLIESRFGLGRVMISTAGQSGNAIAMTDIPEHKEIYEMIQEKQRQAAQ